MTAYERAPWWAAHQQFPARRPLISVVLAVAWPEGFPRCLDSILDQLRLPDGLGVIPGDASPDGCGQILGEWARKQFFDRTAANFRLYRPPGYATPAGPRGLNPALISRDACRAHAMLPPLSDARVAARRVLARAR